MDRLIAGYRRFRQTRWPKMQSTFERLAEGQSPRMLVIACSDSRVDPSSIFDVEPGELFIIRNVANLAPPFAPSPGLHGVSAALEFAVKELKVRTVLVLGHARCGGVKAALNGVARVDSPFLADWVSLLGEAASKVAHTHGPDEACSALELESIRVSLANLRTFPFVQAGLDAGTLELVGARFDIADGSLSVLDPELGVFHDIGVG